MDTFRGVNPIPSTPQCGGGSGHLSLVAGSNREFMSAFRSSEENFLVILV